MDLVTYTLPDWTICPLFNELSHWEYGSDCEVTFPAPKKETN